MNLGIETETLEFKKSTGELKEAVNSIVAILNKHQCGELYFGVKSDGTVVGQTVTEESLREVSQKIKNFIEPQIYPEIPVDAIREALLNSFCHKDYASGQSNEVAIYKDRVEIYNPGAFPDGFEPQDFIDRPERPIRRNPQIARILYYSKDIESFGTGLRRIAESCENAGVQYEFRKIKSGFVVCFYRDGTDEVRKSMGKVRECTGKVRECADKMNEAQKEIVEFVLENGKITNKVVREMMQVKESRAFKILKELVDMEIVEKRGKGKNSYYVMKER